MVWSPLFFKFFKGPFKPFFCSTFFYQVEYRNVFVLREIFLTIKLGVPMSGWGMGLRRRAYRTMQSTLLVQCARMLYRYMNFAWKHDHYVRYCFINLWWKKCASEVLHELLFFFLVSSSYLSVWSTVMDPAGSACIMANPGSGALLTPLGWVKKIKIRDSVWTSGIIFPRAYKQFFALIMLKFIDADPDPGSRIFWSEIQDGKIRIQDKHPRSATSFFKVKKL